MPQNIFVFLPKIYGMNTLSPVAAARREGTSVIGQRLFAMVITIVLSLIAVHPCHAQTDSTATPADSLGISPTDFGFEYIYTDNVAFIRAYNLGDSTITITSVSVPSVDSLMFDVRFSGPVTLTKGNHTLITVIVHPFDTLHHTTTLTVNSNAVDSSVAVTIGATGAYVNVGTFVAPSQAYPDSTISVPAIISSFHDTIGLLSIQSYNCEITYDPTLLTIDTSDLTPANNSLGISSHYVFHFDLASRPGNIKFHAVAGPLSAGTISTPGDTIIKINFIANQAIVNPQSDICITFTPDSIAAFGEYFSTCSTFTELPCITPAGVYTSTAAHFIGITPNPLVDKANIRFSNDKTGYVQLVIYDAEGRIVRTLVDGIVAQGEHSVLFDASGLPSSVYACHLFTPISSETQFILRTR